MSKDKIESEIIPLGVEHMDSWEGCFKFTDPQIQQIPKPKSDLCTDINESLFGPDSIFQGKEFDVSHRFPNPLIEQLKENPNLMYFGPCTEFEHRVTPQTITFRTPEGIPFMEVTDNPVVWPADHVQVLTRDFIDDGIYVQNGIQVLMNGYPAAFTVQSNSSKSAVVLKDAPADGNIQLRYKYEVDEAAFYHKDHKRPDWNCKPTKIGGVKASKEKRKAAKSARKKNRRK
jgi:hypothetical protein